MDGDRDARTLATLTVQGTKSTKSVCCMFLVPLTASVRGLYAPMLLFGFRVVHVLEQNTLVNVLADCRHGFFHLVTVRVVDLSSQGVFFQAYDGLLVEQLSDCYYLTMSLSLPRRGMASEPIADRGIRR